MNSKARFYTRRITYLALFTALTIVLASGKFMPVTSLKLSFATVPSMFAGIFLGPLSGFFCGFVGDYFGAMINSGGAAYLPTIGLAAGLIGAIPGVMFYIPKLHPYLKILLSFVLTTLICTCFINTLTLWWVFSRASGKTFWVYLGGRLPMQLINTAINMALVLGLYYPMKKFVFRKPMRLRDIRAEQAQAPTEGIVVTSTCDEMPQENATQDTTDDSAQN